MKSPILQKLEASIKDTVSAFQSEVSSIRGSRPTPALVEDIVVDYYGQISPIKQIGSISVVPPREIQISVWDVSIVNAVAKAISEKLNVQAASDGNVVHVNLPSLTQERRDEIGRMIKSKAEDARIKSRTLRDDAKSTIDDQEEKGEITEDDKFRLLDELQEMMDSFNKTIDEIVEKKLKDIQD